MSAGDCSSGDPDLRALEVSGPYYKKKNDTLAIDLIGRPVQDKTACLT